MTPLPLGEGGGEGYRQTQYIAEPLTPTLSPKGRGSKTGGIGKTLTLASEAESFSFAGIEARLVEIGVHQTFEWVTRGASGFRQRG